MELGIGIGLTLIAFLGMEGVAWFTHKYIMHGLLWKWHKSHHRPHAGFLERNDLFSLFFSLLAMAMIMVGAYFYDSLWPMMFLGFGVTLYGMVYFVFHDVIVHRRIKHRWKFSGYIRRMVRIHKIHHKNLEKEGADAFGFLYASKKFRDS